MNKLDNLFRSEKKILSIYLTAGYPELNDTGRIILALQDCGVDMIEVGMPFSDPVADGPIIQHSSEVALKNGMNIAILMDQLAAVKGKIVIPLLLMGYLNPPLHFGFERFCKSAAAVGIDGLILPDLPLDEYERLYHSMISNSGLKNIFLATPTTSDERLQHIDELSTSFIYGVSSTAVTGKALTVDAQREEYLKRLKSKNLKHPLVVGFGVSSKRDFDSVCQYASGAIIGSAFIEALTDSKLGTTLEARVATFISDIRR